MARLGNGFHSLHEVKMSGNRLSLKRVNLVNVQPAISLDSSLSFQPQIGHPYLIFSVHSFLHLYKCTYIEPSKRENAAKSQAGRIIVSQRQLLLFSVNII